MCDKPVWDMPRGHKLAKCWNSSGHEHGAPLAFDTMTCDGRHASVDEILRCSDCADALERMEP
jgi:hypothetical protein